MANEDFIPEFERLFEQLDMTDRPELGLIARWLCYVLRKGHSARAEAGATMLTAIRMLALAAEKPGLLSNEAQFAKDAMLRASRRIKLLAEDLVYHHQEIKFPWMPDAGGEGG